MIARTYPLAMTWEQLDALWTVTQFSQGGWTQDELSAAMSTLNEVRLPEEFNPEIPEGALS